MRWLLPNGVEGQDEVAWVNYPGLESSSYKKRGRVIFAEGPERYRYRFGIKGGFEAAKTFTDATKVFSLLANIGDTKSLIIHPASTTHQQLKEDEQEGGWCVSGSDPTFW